MSALNRATKFNLTKKPFIEGKLSVPVNWYQKLGLRSSPLGSTDSADFESIRSQLLRDGKLYEDETFIHDPTVKMMRPKEICSGKAQFYVDGYTRFDVLQGLIGDCWFLAPLACLTMNKKLFSQVVPEGQSFEDGYVGMFRFRFWQFGEWVEVIIDDRLPTYKGALLHLLYLHSSETNEFWSPLFEKAYAKFCGKSYSSIFGGHPREAMMDLTGGLTESYSMADVPSDLYKILLKAYERSSLIVGHIINANKVNIDRFNEVGLNLYHAYSVTKVLSISGPAGETRLLRIRNPHGYNEWKGAWSDKSPEWASIPETKKEEMGLVVIDDGEFWMCYEDFLAYFDFVQLCHLSTECPDPENKLKMTTIKGNWIKGITAGGARDKESSYCYPQYIIKVKDADEGDNENKCTVIIGLLQKEIPDEEILLVILNVYQIQGNGHVSIPLDIDFLANKVLQHKGGVEREISFRLRLEPGSYVIVPSTYHPDVEREFLLRVMSENSIPIDVYDGDLGVGVVEDRVKNFPSRLADLTRDFFNKLAEPNGEVSCKKLKESSDISKSALEFGGRPLPEDMYNSLIAISDRDKSGGLTFEESKQLWDQLRDWHAAFSVCGMDSDHKIPRRKLRAALRAAGWTVNVQLLTELTTSCKLTGDYIHLYEFIRCVLWLMSNKGDIVSQTGGPRYTR